jgi:hypothetical protein
MPNSDKINNAFFAATQRVIEGKTIRHRAGSRLSLSRARTLDSGRHSDQPEAHEERQLRVRLRRREGKFAEMCDMVERYDWREWTSKSGELVRRFGPIPNAQAAKVYRDYMTMFP